jgi:hypothetical protein
VTEPLKFTLRHKDRTNAYTNNGGNATSVSVGVGWLSFTPTFSDGARLPFGSDTALGPRMFAGFLDYDGELKTAPGGDVGIRLWGNDPEFGVTRFQYQVSAPNDLVDAMGLPVKFASFFFDAPSVDEVRYLKDYMPKPGQKFGRGPASSLRYNGVTEDGELAFSNDDGSAFNVAIPAGTLALVDNADSTWTFIDNG